MSGEENKKWSVEDLEDLQNRVAEVDLNDLMIRHFAWRKSIADNTEHPKDPVSHLARGVFDLLGYAKIFIVRDQFSKTEDQTLQLFVGYLARLAEDLADVKEARLLTVPVIDFSDQITERGLS